MLHDIHKDWMNIAYSIDPDVHCNFSNNDVGLVP